MLRSLALACGFLAAAASPLSAQSAVPEGVVSVRLLPGWRTDRGTHMAGLEVTLAPGWKTYWRAPGDAGIPPLFDWGRVENVSGVQMHWPVPEVSHSNGMRSIGYAGHVVIPMEFTTPADGVAARLSGEVEIGVCAEVCIPVRLSVAAELPPGAGHRSPQILAALVDQPVSGADAGVTSVRCRLTPTTDGLRLQAELGVPAIGRTDDVVIEAGDPQVWVSEPVTSRSGGVLSAEADLVHIDGGAFALDRSALRFTILGRDRAIDIRGCD
ncbi:protein-disulfide reductase DsbD domain-containing protein [Roseisalinus antarcticus]|uniref:Thiol:disulfide interchange protein DsbD N-terminal domain-containing protein n=1 Tax=Roseisalinus antarcticus TaxID=254357 RepID=A0A1Y5RNV3_9RHOB|nr:protein-disulfide reductase DsbD domain-containing protein [Roseisalinus antarcticus]SLN21840.1 hypothetical protein ROA7023_00598 [Roseisalinus antarcticus]